VGSVIILFGSEVSATNSDAFCSRGWIVLCNRFTERTLSRLYQLWGQCPGFPSSSVI